MEHFTLSSLCLAGLLSCCPITRADPIEFTYTNINVPGYTNTVLNSINNAGQIVGTYGQHGFLDTNGVFTNIDVPGAIATTPDKINNLGQIVGTYRDSSNHLNLFLDTNGVFTTINVPGGLADLVAGSVGLNDLGQIVGTANISSVPTAFLYSNGQFSFIPPRNPVTGNNSAYDINNAGQIALGETLEGTSYSSYVYFQGTYTILHAPGDSNPMGINNAGHVVGFYESLADLGGYFYADGTITRFSELERPLPHFYRINGLNDADQLVGTGPGGGVLATPIPEPASPLLFAGGLTVVGILTLRSKHDRRTEAEDPKCH